MGLNITSALSALDSSTSLIGLGVKDTANVAGLTGMAYKTGGEHEAREKFIDETGTSILWLGGIPAIRWIFDKTVFKWKGLDPEISIKKLPINANDRGPQVLSFDKLKEFTDKKLHHLSESELVGKYKFMNGAKFLVSTVLPSLLIVVLPKLNQRLSRKIILSRALKEQQSVNIQNNQNKEKNATPISFERNNSDNAGLKSHADNFFKSQQLPAFKGLGDVILNTAAKAQVNPVDNILLVDSVISGNRVTFVPRNKQQWQENMIKEGGFLFFMFLAQKYMQKGFDKLADELKLPVKLDFKILGNETFKKKMQEFKDGKITKESLAKIADTPENAADEGKFIEFLKDSHNKTKPGECLVVDMAKEVGIIKTTGKDRKVFDVKKYVEMADVKKLSDNISSFAEKMKDSGKTVEQFIKKAKILKATFLFASIGICMTALGIVLPKIQYTFRKKYYGSNDYPGIKGYEEEAKKLATQKA